MGNNEFDLHNDRGAEPDVWHDATDVTVHAASASGQGQEYGSNSIESAKELSEWLSQEHHINWRQDLADAAYDAAMSKVDDQYINPFTRAIARDAVQMALGLKKLPEGES